MGVDVNSGIAPITWGLLMLCAGAVGLIGLARGKRRLALAAGIAGVVFAVINVTTLSTGVAHVHVTGSAASIHVTGSGHVTENGERIDEFLDPSIAWGSWLVLAASAILLLSTLLTARSSR